ASRSLLVSAVLVGEPGAARCTRQPGTEATLEYRPVAAAPGDGRYRTRTGQYASLHSRAEVTTFAGGAHDRDRSRQRGASPGGQAQAAERAAAARRAHASAPRGDPGGHRARGRGRSRGRLRRADAVRPAGAARSAGGGGRGGRSRSSGGTRGSGGRGDAVDVVDAFD